MSHAIRIRLPASLDSLMPASVEPRAPREGEVQIRVHASSLNFHDYAVVSGAMKPEDGRIPLSDAAGEVISVGDGVTEFAPGDRVLSTFYPKWLDGEADFVGFATVPGDGVDGFARQYATVPASGLTRMPKGYSFEEGATLPCAGVTAWRALAVNGGLRPGDTVLVQGSGGVSVFALQLAKYAGATVIATSSSDEKLERLKALGADHLINYRSVPKWGEAAARLTDRGGVDHVVEVGGNIAQSIRAIRPGGHVALIGLLAGREATMNTFELLKKQGRLHGLTVGHRQHQLDLIRACESTALRPIIDRTFPLSELADAFRYQLSGAHLGKICIKV